MMVFGSVKYKQSRIWSAPQKKSNGNFQRSAIVSKTQIALGKWNFQGLSNDGSLTLVGAFSVVFIETLKKRCRRVKTPWFDSPWNGPFPGAI